MKLVRRLGADSAVDGKREDLKAAALAFAPDGVDAVLGLVGGEALDQRCDAIRRGGRMAYPNGVEPEPKKRRGIDIDPTTPSPACGSLSASAGPWRPRSCGSRSPEPMSWPTRRKRTNGWSRATSWVRSLCAFASLVASLPRKGIL